MEDAKKEAKSYVRFSAAPVHFTEYFWKSNELTNECIGSIILYQRSMSYSIFVLWI